MSGVKHVRVGKCERRRNQRAVDVAPWRIALAGNTTAVPARANQKSAASGGSYTGLVYRAGRLRMY